MNEKTAKTKTTTRLPYKPKRADYEAWPDSPFRGSMQLRKFARVFNREGIRLDEFRPSLLPEYGSTGAFRVSRTGWLIYVINQVRGKKAKVVKTTRMNLPTLYARLHGVEDWKLSRASQYVWMQRVLYDAGVIRLDNRRLFRKPNDNFKRSLGHDKNAWRFALAVLDGLGLLCDLRSDELVPFSGPFAARWLDRSMTINLPLRKVAAMVIEVRTRLVKAGLVVFKGSGRDVLYGIAPPDEGHGLAKAELLHRWD